MALQFVLGKASKNHFNKIVADLKAAKQANPNDQYFYLVPNHIKFDSELNTLQALDSGKKSTFAETKVQIFSFSRLVWYFLSESEGYQLPRLSSDAINMLLYQIIVDKDDELTVFKGESNQPGFIQQVADQIAELQQGQIDPDTLEQMAGLDQREINPELSGKLHDIAVIYREFIERTDDKYLYPSRILKMLEEYLLTHDISKMHFYISGFSQMSAQEIRIMQTLIDNAGDVTVDLNLDQPFVREAPDPSSFFLSSGRLYHQLYQYARGQHQKIMVDKYADETRVSEGVSELEEYWISSNEFGKKIPVKQSENNDVEVYEANSPYDELMNVAIKIRQMVATGKYRYTDFLVLTRHLDLYENVIDPIFKMQQIPYFVDIQKKMENHPLVELIDALFSIYRGERKRNYRYADVMRLLKSELLLPIGDNGKTMNIKKYRQDVALTENFVLKNGYEGSRWTQDEDWHYSWLVEKDTGVGSDLKPEISAKINVIRHFIKQTLPPFYQKMEKAKTGRDAAKILYEFLVKNGVAERLQLWQADATEHGELQEAGQAEQVWNTLCSLLDDYVNILGNEPFHLDHFLDTLRAGFEGASYSQIPSTLDQVSLSETGMVQPTDKKVTFVIGADDDNMPAAIQNNSLFNDADRDQMSGHFNDDQYLNDTSETQMVSEPYLNYLAFMTPSEKLIFSYNRGGNDVDTERNLSPYVSRIQKQFNLALQPVNGIPRADEEDITTFIGTKRTSLKYLIKASYDAKLNKVKLSSSWENVENQLLADTQLHNLTQKLMGSLSYKNVPASLKPEIVTGLYGNEINTSISKLEEYYYDPYEYFLKYGLKLRKRDEFELNAANTGTFFHDSLDLLTKKINQENIDVRDLSDSDIRQLVDDVTGSILKNDPNMQYEILKSSSRMGYITSQLVLTITQMATTIRNQSYISKMRPVKSEVIFGDTGDPNNLKGLAFDLGDEKKINVRGRIDRIDKVHVDGTDYLGIVDYKSGDKQMNLSKAYDGTRMQMITYLDAVKKNIGILNDGERAKLAGALYMRIFNPRLKPDKNINLSDEKQVSKALLRKHQYNGLLINQGHLLRDMLEKPDESNLVYPYKFNKDGYLTESSLNKSVIDRFDLDLLLEHNEELIKEAGKEILAGNTELAPARFGTETGMTFSDYKSIMQFDPLLPENNYRIIEPIGNTQDVLERLREEARENDK